MRNLLARRSSRIAAMGIVMVLALVFGAVYFATSAESSVQVSNLDQTLATHNSVAVGQQVNGSQYVAQAFTTGDNASGYILDSIQIKILEGSSDGAFITLHIGKNDRPGAKVYDLTGDLSSTGNQSFSAPANASLAANTQYFVLIGLDSGATDVAELAVTASGDEDAGAASGWSIDERLTFFEGGSSVSISSAPAMIAVVAEARPTAGSELQVSNLGQTPAEISGSSVTLGVSSLQYVAQAFTTGDNASGYILDSIQIKVYESSSEEVSATLHLSDNNRPGTKVYDLTGDLSSTGNQSFSAPPNATLTANTEYFVRVILASGATDLARLTLTDSNDEDAGAASGWSIGDISVYLANQGTSEQTDSASLMIAVVVATAGAANNPASGQPVITTPHGYWVGQALSAGFGNITDPDGLTAASPSYQWIRDDDTDETEITDATSSKYTLTANDEGKRIKVKVSFTDDAGNTENLLSSDLTPVIDPVPNILVSTLDTPAEDDRLQEIPTFSGGRWAQLLTTGDNSGGYTPAHVYVSIGESGGDANAPQPRVTLNASVKATKTLADNTDTEISIPGAVLYALRGDVDEAISSSETVIFSFPADASLTAETEYFIVFGNNGGLTPSYNIDATVFDDEDEDAASGWQINFGGVYTLASNPTVADWGIETSYSAKIAVTGEDKAVIVNHLATGAPTINGTARVGETLTASTSAISDTDGLTNVSYTYQWIRIDGNLEINISSGTSSTYQVVAADQGKTLKVQVSFTDDDGNAEGLFSAATSTVAAAAQGNNPATGAPTINGTARVGETLTASTSAISDTDGLTNVSYTYQWIRVDGNSENNISTATSSTYQVVAADQGKTLKVQVSFTDDDSNTETLTSIATSTSTVAAAAQGNNPATGAPTINGTARVGETLTASTSAISDADGLTNVSYTYQWIRVDGNSESNITSASGQAYQLTTADTGKNIKVKVSFTDNDSNAEELTSAATSTVAAAVQVNNPATGAPTINGTARVGETLTASTSAISDADGLTNVSYTYQWIRVDGNSESNITSASGQAYQLTTADTGKNIKVKVSFTDNDSNAEELTSAATSTVAAAVQVNNPATGAPTINGTARVGQTLTAATSTIADADGLTNVSYTYQWIRVDGNSENNISTATSSTYQVVAADTGKSLKVKVSFTDDDSNAEELTSAATSTVVTAAQGNNPATGAPTISGTARVGRTLTAGSGTIADADGLTNVSYTYQWIRVDGNNESNITSATASTHRLVAADVGKRIKVKVSFTDDDSNAEELTSAASLIVARSLPKKKRTNNPATGAPTILGTVRVGQTLTVDTDTIADDDGLSGVSYSYQWIRVDNNSDIASAGGQTYRLTDADVDKRLQVRVTFEDDRGYTEELTSAITSAVATVAQPNNPATGAPIITGVAYIGQTLTADIGTIADADGLSDVSYSYQWIRVDGEKESIIVGATSSTYRLIEANINKRLQVRVTFEDDRGYVEELISATTVIVTVYVEEEREEAGDPPIAPIAPSEEDNEEEEEEELGSDDDDEQESASEKKSKDDVSDSGSLVWIIGTVVVVAVIAAGAAVWFFLIRRPAR